MQKVIVNIEKLVDSIEINAKYIQTSNKKITKDIEEALIKSVSNFKIAEIRNYSKEKAPIEKNLSKVKKTRELYLDIHRRVSESLQLLEETKDVKKVYAYGFEEISGALNEIESLIFR